MPTHYEDEMLEDPLSGSASRTTGSGSLPLEPGMDMGGMGMQDPNIPLMPADYGMEPSNSADLENVSQAQDLAEELVLIDHMNYALDSATVQRFDEEIQSKLPQIEDQRQPLEDLWGECEDIWLRRNNEVSRYYTGINDAYMPTGFRAIETHVQHTMSQLFPLIFAVIPKQPFTPPEVIQRSTSLLEHDSLQADLETNFEPFVRNAFIYGWVPEKTIWKEETKRNYKLINNNGEIAVAMGAKPVKTYCGPTFDVIDPYDLYIHPFDAKSISKAEIVHQYIRTDMRKLKRNDASLTGNPRDIFLGVTRLETESKGPTSANRWGEERKNRRNEKYSLRKDQIVGKHEKVMCQVWCKFDLYDTGDIVDCKATIVDGVVIELRQNPLKSQEPPYITWSPFNTGRHIYNMGMCEIMRVLVYTLNAIMNQMLDANLFQTNQMMAIDTNRYQGRPSDIEVSPLGVFPFGGVGPVGDAIAFFKPEMDLQQTLMAANLMAATIQDSVAASTTMQGKFSGKERTKGEVEMVTGAAMVGVSAMVRSLSVNVLAKWFEQVLELEAQYRDPMDTMKITGAPDIQLPFEDRIYKYWVRVLTTPEAEQFRIAQAAGAMQQQGDENSNPTGINSEGGTQPQGMGGSAAGTDGGF